MDTLAKKLLWKLATIKCCLYSIATLGSCWMTATNNIDMTKMAAWDWFQTIFGCIIAWSLTMAAFVDRSAAQIGSGKLPGLEINMPDDTAMITKTDTVSVQSTTTKTP